jgi:hypothetical protein
MNMSAAAHHGNIQDTFPDTSGVVNIISWAKAAVGDISLSLPNAVGLGAGEPRSEIVWHPTADGVAPVR